MTCAVSSGDMPVYFSWKKDDAPISISLQITEKKDEFFSLLVFKDITARHSGKYTCYAANSASKVNYTAELLVRGEILWRKKNFYLIPNAIFNFANSPSKMDT